MPEHSELDQAHAAMEAAPDDDAARLRFYQCLADTELFLLLREEPVADLLQPAMFDLEEGSFVLAFDAEHRMTAFTGAPAPYAALPGRIIALHLAGQGTGLGLNLGVAPSSFLMPAGAVDWLAQTLGHAPETLQARAKDYFAPEGLPPALLRALAAKLARAGGMAGAALLAGVRYEGGRRGHILAFLDANPASEAALAGAVAEALTFSGIEAGELDVVFLRQDDPAIAKLAHVALSITLPDPPQAEAPAPAPSAPGMDPSRPPRLR